MYETALVYITAAGKEEAEKIANSVITERLAACANILGDVSSIFLWKGTIQNESEIGFFLKTAIEKNPTINQARFRTSFL
jgi:periplasmic divalent cation tolerance protein